MGAGVPYFVGVLHFGVYFHLLLPAQGLHLLRDRGEALVE